MPRTGRIVKSSWLAVAAIVGSAASAAADPKVVVTSKMRTVTVNDDAWGIPAFTMKIPEDWKFEGALLRDPYCDNAPVVAIRASSPDGLSGYQMLPTFGWHSSDDPSFVAQYRKSHCKIMEPLSPADFLAYVVPSIRPNPTIGTIGPTADAKQIDAQIEQYNQRNQAAHSPTSQQGGGVRAVVEYQLHGHAVEENLRVVVSTFRTQVGAYGRAQHSVYASTANVSGLRAPKGQLQEVGKALQPMVASITFTPEWTKRMMAKMAADNQRAMDLIKQQGEAITATLKRNHDAWMKRSRETFDKSQAIDRERNDAMHRSAVAWTLYAGDEQLVRNPQTGSVTRVSNQASNGHQDAVSGDIIMSTDSSFDPSYYVRGTWTQLENVDPLKP